MPIKTIYREGRYFPSVVCDHCGEAVDEAHKGHALWIWGEVDPAAQADQEAEVFLVHQRCDYAFSKAQGRRFAWEPLEAFLYRILLNTGFRRREAKKHAKMLSAL